MRPHALRVSAEHSPCEQPVSSWARGRARGKRALPGVRIQITVNPSAVAAQLLASLEYGCCCWSADNPPHRGHSEKALALESSQPGAMFPCKAVLCLLMNTSDVSGPSTSAPAGQPLLLLSLLDARSNKYSHQKSSDWCSALPPCAQCQRGNGTGAPRTGQEQVPSSPVLAQDPQQA